MTADAVPQWGGRRAQEARALIADTLPAPCIRCGLTVWPWQAWDLGHRRDRDTYPELTWDPTNWGPEHRGENRAAGAVLSNHKRTGKRSGTGRQGPARPWTAPGW